ncbi:CDP-glycerol glycerophosphotransferase family protein [Alysiella filiformis]|uniref:TPR repeat-containing protein n=1 Tax=Alysiella filiformis DSM 16848 TaxID=1120981 RepID=A0A286E3D2_9NEIS|nr:CDP-glycerol glycerophosphotransferase family protein [Alysiella filiformis]UBQ55908.1 CDP-glycerol glycerophosphotransferase family protein [Alysiella filiformis DSM 16848]SOD65406.1 TPR repeat-containing protein [Alysiella filiformis DSM 16848]
MMKHLKNAYHHITAPAGYHQGLALYNQKKWQAALEAFQSADAINPIHAKNAFKLGLCHLKLGNLHEAQYYLTQAVELAPYNQQWQIQLEQCQRQIEYKTQGAASAATQPVVVPRIHQSGETQSLGISLKKKLLLIPSDYNHRVMADIDSFIEYYKNDFNIYIILRHLNEDIVYRSTHTLVKNGSSFGEFLKFTADYVIDAGTMNYGYRITDTNTWVSVWHGIPYKKMFVDFDVKHLATAIRYNLAYDCMISMSDFYTDVFLRGAMRYDGKILQLGCAKTDKLFQKEDNQGRLKRLFQSIRLPENAKIILYAPDFRQSGEMVLPFDATRLLATFGQDYCLLVLLSSQTNTAPANSPENVYYTADLNDSDALLIADILISDYHTLIYTFDQYNRPVALFHHDYETFAHSHPQRHQELRILSRRPFRAENEDELCGLDWTKLKQYSLDFALHENIGSAFLKTTLGIPHNKKIIFYAPTFRKAGAMPLPFSPQKLLNALNHEYVIITKLHYLNHLDQRYDNVIDCTSYSNIADLMKISDILISDYSSLVLDFALLNKPIVLFQYDYADYMQQRGVYFDFGDYLLPEQIVQNEDELYQLNWHNLSSNNHKIINTFYPLEDGQSTQRIVDALAFNKDMRHGKDIIFLVNELNQIGGVHTFLKNMAKHYKQKYNSRIFVIAIREFAETNSEFHQLQSPYIDFKLSAQYLNGACANILQNTDGIVIALQFSAQLHFQKYLTHAKSVLMFHGDVKDMISRELYAPHLGWLNEGKLYNYRRLLLLTQSAVDLLRPHLVAEVQNKLGYMHNSIDAQYCPLEPRNPLHTAVISRLDADKNIFSMIDLGKEIAKQNANIVVHIYGDGELKDEFQAALNQNGLQNILKLHGFESDKEKIFGNSDSLLLMSKSEGFPLVVLEAYAHARPVIAFDSFTSAQEIIKHGETGYLTAYGDYAAIIAAIQNAHTLSPQAIQATFEQFSNAQIFAKWDKLIGELDAEANQA